METAEVEYGGYVIKQPSSAKDVSECQVYIESENPHKSISYRAQGNRISKERQ
jgi:hypothetical protein